jgi:hypothetical protein
MYGACGNILDIAFRDIGVPLSTTLFGFTIILVSIIILDIAFRDIGVLLSTTVFGFTIIPDIPALRSAFPAFTTFLAFLSRIRGTRKRGTLPHSRASAFRDIGVPLSITLFGFTIILDIPAPRSAFSAFTTFLAFHSRIRGTRKRGTLPHSRASAFRDIRVPLSITLFGFTIILDIPAPRSAFPAFTTFLAFLSRIRGTRKRGTLPHSRASAFRDIGVSLSTTIFDFAIILDIPDNIPARSLMLVWEYRARRE